MDAWIGRTVGRATRVAAWKCTSSTRMRTGESSSARSRFISTGQGAFRLMRSGILCHVPACTAGKVSTADRLTPAMPDIFCTRSCKAAAASASVAPGSHGPHCRVAAIGVGSGGGAQRGQRRRGVPHVLEQGLALVQQRVPIIEPGTISD